jgi:hypothetical protein
MIKVLTSCTGELDSPEKAVQDILNQLDMKSNLLKNSVALLFCRSRFIEMGVMEEVCKSLPFDVLGCTSMYFALPEQEGEIMLTVTVLTSDDTEFATGFCQPLTPENSGDCINEAYQKTAAVLGGTPDLVFAFPPTMINLPIDMISAALDSASGGLPCFGAVALDADMYIRNPQTIYKGVAYNDRLGLLLFKGPVKPQFFFLGFPENLALAQDAVVTAADGSKLVSINNKSAVSFLQEVGLMQKGKTDYTQAIPLIIENSDGSNPEVVVVQHITTGGILICSRQVPVGGKLNIGAITADYVLESARTLVQDIKEHEGGMGLLIVSCFLRSIVLGEGAGAEVKLIQRELAGFSDTYLYFNSGGELCPRYKKSGDTENQALQYSIIACKF